MAKTWIHVYVDSYSVCVFRKKLLGEGKQKESKTTYTMESKPFSALLWSLAERSSRVFQDGQG